MSAELALLTSLKKDVKLYGNDTKELLLTAGEDLSEATKIAVGVDGKAYDVLNIEKLEPVLNDTVSRTVNSSSTIINNSVTLPNGASIIMSHFNGYQTNANYKDYQAMNIVLIGTDGTLKDSINVFNDLYYDSNGYTSAIPGIYDISIIDDTTIAIQFINWYRDGDNYPCYLNTYVYSINDTATALSQESSNRTVVRNTTSGYSNANLVSYGNIFNISNKFYAVFFDSDYYEFITTIDPTDYSISVSDTSSDDNFHNRSSDNQGYIVKKKDANGNDIIFYNTYPSVDTDCRIIKADGTITTAGDISGSYSDTTHYFVLDDMLFFIDINANTLEEIVFNDDGTFSTNSVSGITAVQLSKFIDIMRYTYYGKYTTISIGDKKYFIIISSSYTRKYEDEQGSGTYNSYSAYLISVYRDENGNVVFTEEYEIKDETDNILLPNSNSKVALVQTADGVNSIIAQSDNGYNSNYNYIKTNLGVYPAGSIDSTKPKSTFIDGYSTTAAAKDENVTVVVTGSIAAIDVPVGTKVNDWVGIGGNKAILPKKL